jgi:hypothetical protein
MRLKSKMSLTAIVLSGLVLVGCVGAPKAPDFKPLNASLADAKWDGKTIPSNEVCHKFNSRAGNAPKIAINNLNATSTKIELSFNDESAGPEFNFGGHVVIEYQLPNEVKNSITVPSIPGQVKELPENFSIKRNFTSRAWDTGFGYLPPCSGGKGNLYTVTIKAYNDKGEITGDTKLTLGRY